MTSSPQGLFQLTGPDAYRVEDADEEVYLLHVRSGENTEGLGVVDSKHDTLCVTLRISSQAGRSCPEDIQVVLHQNCTALRSRAGDTGLSLIHISEPTRHTNASRMPSSA